SNDDDASRALPSSGDDAAAAPRGDASLDAASVDDGARVTSVFDEGGGASADEGGGASAGGGCCAVDGELPTGGAPADVPCDEGAGTSGADDGAAATSREDDRDDPTSED